MHLSPSRVTARRCLPAVILCACLTATSAAGAPKPLTTPGVPAPQQPLVRRTYDVLVHGHVAFLASTVGVVVVDVKDPTRPRYLGALPLPGSVTALARAGDKIVAALGPAGIAILDASRPDRPRKIGAVRLSGAAMDVVALGDLVLVASGSAGLQVIDLKDPARPRKVGHDDTPGYARAVVARGDRAFLADGSSVRIYKITAGRAALESTLELRGQAHDLAIDGSKLLVAAGAAGLVAASLAGGAPKVLGRLGMRDKARDVAAGAGGAAIVADGTHGVAVVDTSRAAAPRETARFRPPRAVNKITVIGNMAYVANDHDGLLILELHGTGRPTFVGSIPPRKK